MDEKQILCVSNAYERKFYLGGRFRALPEGIREELQILCVLFTEDVGGILTLEFNEDGSLYFHTASDEGDLLYDEIGSALKVRQIRQEHRELWEALEMYYRVFILGQSPEEAGLTADSEEEA